MIPSTPSDQISDFIRFLEAMMGRDAADARVAAGAAELSRLLGLVKLPLPPLYLGYLQEFGGSSGPFHLADDTSTDVKALIRFHEEPDPVDRGVPERGVVIAAYGLSGERALVYPEEVDLSVGTDVPLPEPVVVVSWWGDVSHTCARSFRNLLYRAVFIGRYFPDTAPCSLRRGTDVALRDIIRQLSQLGFVPHWFSDDYQACLERDDGAAVYVEQDPTSTFLFGQAANEPALIQFKRHLVEQLGFQEG
jgi:hypothetical protein